MHATEHTLLVPPVHVPEPVCPPTDVCWCCLLLLWCACSFAALLRALLQHSGTPHCPPTYIQANTHTGCAERTIRECMLAQKPAKAVAQETSQPGLPHPLLCRQRCRQPHPAAGTHRVRIFCLFACSMRRHSSHCTGLGCAPSSTAAHLHTRTPAHHTTRPLWLGKPRSCLRTSEAHASWPE